MIAPVLPERDYAPCWAEVKRMGVSVYIPPKGLPIRWSPDEVTFIVVAPVVGV